MLRATCERPSRVRALRQQRQEKSGSESHLGALRARFARRLGAACLQRRARSGRLRAMAVAMRASAGLSSRRPVRGSAAGSREAAPRVARNPVAKHVASVRRAALAVSAAAFATLAHPAKLLRSLNSAGGGGGAGGHGGGSGGAGGSGGHGGSGGGGSGNSGNWLGIQAAMANEDLFADDGPRVAQTTQATVTDENDEAFLCDGVKTLNLPSGPGIPTKACHPLHTFARIRTAAPRCGAARRPGAASTTARALQGACRSQSAPSDVSSGACALLNPKRRLSLTSRLHRCAG